MIDSLALLALALLVGGNNVSALVGPMVGARMVSLRSSLAVSGMGGIVGLFLEGHKLQLASESLLPGASERVILLSFLVVGVVFLAGNLVRVPVSLSQGLVGASVGLALFYSLPLDYGYVSLVLVSWLVVPFLGVAIAYVVGTTVGSGLRGFGVSSRVLFFRAGALVASFYSSYVLGANTLGLLTYMAPFGREVSLLTVGAGYVGGIGFLGRGVARRVGEDLYVMDSNTAFSSQISGATVVELFTQLAVPVSATQSLVSGVLGSGLSKTLRVIDVRSVALLVGEWIAAPLFAFAAGYGVPFLVQVLPWA